MKRTERAEVLEALTQITRTIEWLRSEDVQVSRRFGGEFVPIAKDIGSPLQFLEHAQKRLHALAAAP